MAITLNNSTAVFAALRFLSSVHLNEVSNAVTKATAAVQKAVAAEAATRADGTGHQVDLQV